MPADLPPFDPKTSKPNSTILPPERVPVPARKTWAPDGTEQGRGPRADRRPLNTTGAPDGTLYSSGLDGSNPATMEKLAGGAFLSSDKLLTGEEE